MRMTSSTGGGYSNPTFRKKANFTRLNQRIGEKYRIVPYFAREDDLEIQQSAKDSAKIAYMSSIEYRYEELAIAIVLMACRDYVYGRKSNLKDAYKKFKSAREFLLSDRLSLYTNVDGKKIVEKLDSVDDWYQFELNFVRGGYCND